MELVKEGKLRSEDIAKMVSLRGKTHYDILREISLKYTYCSRLLNLC